MSNSAKNPSKEQQNKHLQQNFFKPGPSNSASNMGRPSGPSANIKFFRQAHDPVRDHNPSDKMNNWFPKDKFPAGSRALSWMTENSKKTNHDLDFGISDDFWESDFSDEFISKIMNDTSQESSIPRPGKPQTITSTSSASTSSSALPVNRTKLGEKYGIKSSVSSSFGSSLAKQPAKNLTRGPSFGGATSTSSSDNSPNLTGVGSSQRKMLTQSKSFNLSNNPGQSRTTEWLRSQLEKTNKECRSLKEEISVKDGETKILRNKLNEAKSTIEKQKMEKEIECLQVKANLEEKITALKKELKNTETQMLFKSKEAESNIERYKELKKVNVVEPQFSQLTTLSQSFKKFASRNEKSKPILEGSECFLPVLTQKILSIETETKSVQTEVVACMEVKSLPANKRFEFSFKKLANYKSSRNLGKELSDIILPFIFKKAKLQHSVVVPEEMEYVSFETLYRDSSEISPIDYDDSAVRENLFMLWGEDSTGLKRRPNQTIRESCYFSALTSVRTQILSLCDLPKWNDPNLSQQIIDHVTKMARELFVALRDKAVLKKVFDDQPRKNPAPCWDKDELDSNPSMFSHVPWNDEVYIDLRRGISLIAALCQLDPAIRKSVLEKSRFIKQDISRTIETFSPDELEHITCTSDTLTDNYIHCSTFNHKKASVLLSDRINSMKNKIIKNNDRPLFCNVAKEHLPTVDPNKLTEETLKYFKNLKKVSPSTVSHPKPYVSKFANEKEADFFGSFNFNTLQQMECDDPPISSKVDVLQILDKNDIISYARHKPTLNSELPPKLLDNCTSDIERELLCSSFKTYLKMKENMESSELLPKSSIVCEPLESKLDENININDTMNSRKRKIPSDNAEPSTSRMPETSARKRDLAPLKRPRKGNEEMATQEIQDELEIIYQDCIKPKEPETRVDEEYIVDLPRMNTPIGSESFLVYKNEDGPLYEYLYPEEIASQCELLPVILEIVRSVGCFGFTTRFNGLLAATATLLISLTKLSSFSLQIKRKYVGAIIHEIVYCSPSSRVLLLIHQLLKNCVALVGFNKLLCRNAKPDKFVRKINQIVFKRGACLLSMMCMFSELYVPDKHWDMQEHFIEWVGYLFLVDNSTIARIYRRQRMTSGQCKCAESLSSAVIRILAKAVGVYYNCYKRKGLNSLLDLQLVKIIKYGLKILSIMVNLDTFFKQNVKMLYVNYISFLESTKYFHYSKDFKFTLCANDLLKLNLLIEKVDKKLQKKPYMSDEFKLKFLCYS